MYKFILTVVVLLNLSVNAFARENVKIVGSSTIFPFSNTVADYFDKEDIFPEPIIESTGSGDGINLFCKGIGIEFPDIVASSRRVTEEEIHDCKKNGVNKFTELKIGYDGIAFVTSGDMAGKILTLNNIWRALSPYGGPNKQRNVGLPQVWSEIDEDLPERAIKVILPPPTSGTRASLIELAMQKGCLFQSSAAAKCDQLKEDSSIMEGTEDDFALTKYLEEDGDVIGVVGYSYLSSNANTISALSIDGILPSSETIQKRTYPLSRPLFLYVKNRHVEIIPGMEEFLFEFTSDAALGTKGYLINKGLVPMTNDELKAESYKATSEIYEK